jgi:hypothetical protein
VVFLHGRHATCFNGQGAAFLEWPCSNGRTPIPSYQGYDYVGALLASQGYFVVSISANGVNAVDNAVFDLGALARRAHSVFEMRTYLERRRRALARASARST